MQFRSIGLIFIVFFICNSLSAQYEDDTYHDQNYARPNNFTSYGSDENANRLLIGGSIALGVGSGNFQIGAAPEVVYTLTNQLQAGISINFNYQNYSNNNDDQQTYYRQRSMNIGGGPMLRFFPTSQFFLQSQFEENYINENLKNGDASYTRHTTANSLLIGGGYAVRTSGGCFFTQILFDVLQDPDSPYRDENNHVIPVIRAGVSFFIR